MNTDNRIFTSPPVQPASSPQRGASPTNTGPRESFVPGSVDSPLGTRPSGQSDGQPTTYPSGLQFMRDQSRVAFQAVLPAAGLLPVPLFIQSVNGQITARAQNAPDQALNAQLCQDGKVYVHLQPNAPLAVFDPQTLEFGLTTEFKRDPQYGTTLRDHAMLVAPDGTRRSIFNEAVGQLPGMHHFTEIREALDGRTSGATWNGSMWNPLEVTGHSSQGYAVREKQRYWQSAPQMQMHLMPFSAAAPGSLFPPIQHAVQPQPQPQPSMSPMEEVHAALNRGDLATVQRIMSQVPPPETPATPPAAPAPTRRPSFADGKTIEQVGQAFATLEGGYTAQHTARVTEYATSMAYILGLPKERVEVLQQAVDLFDVGKLEVPREVLDKVGKYTDAEFAAMKEHVKPEVLAPYLEMFGASDEVAAVVMTHHERPDGKGYPFGLTADKIPFEASLIAVADAFDSMTNKRWNRLDRPDAPEALSSEKAMEILKKNAGTQFHPLAVEAMGHLLDFLKKQQSFAAGKTAPEVGTAFAGLEDGYTARHSQRAVQHAVRTAGVMGLGEQEIQDLVKAGDVYDMGKLDVPSEILDKTGKYTDEEFAEMKKHVDPQRMQPYFELFKTPEGAQAIALAHHERPDGKGYPNGLKADQIPMGARILAVADAFDAMTEKRWNRLDRPDAPEAMSPEKALEILKKNAGTQFDAAAVAAFEQTLNLETPAQVANQFAALEGGYTAAHAMRATGHAVGVATMLGLPESDVKALIEAGNVFDMGKLDVPPEILDKTGKYTDEEFAQMKKHVDPQRMEKYFRLFNVSDAAREAALTHHERPDGKGYPRGLTDIPLTGRILAVADAFDAMTQKRWSRLDRPDAPEAMSPEKALEILKKNAGSQFDPQVVEAFERVLESRRPSA